MGHFAATSAKYPAVLKHVMKIFCKTKPLDLKPLFHLIANKSEINILTVIYLFNLS